MTKRKWIVLAVCLLALAQGISAQQRLKVGLVLGGGGAKGAAEVGVLKAIEESGIPIDYVAGTSIGSIVGGLYSVGYRAAELDSLFSNQNWLSLLSGREDSYRKKIFKQDEGVTYLFGFPVKNTNKSQISKRHGMLRGEKVLNFLDSLIDVKQVARVGAPLGDSISFDAMPIPFRCVAFDIKQLQEVVLADGDLPLAMRASMAIPGAFRPVELDSARLVDGGMINNLPVDVVRQMGADVVIAIDLQQNKHDDYKSPLHFLSGLGGVAKWLAERPDIAKYNVNRTQADVYINPVLGDLGVTDFKPAAIQQMIKIGEQTGQSFLIQLLALKQKVMKGK